MGEARSPKLDGTTSSPGLRQGTVVSARPMNLFTTAQVPAKQRFELWRAYNDDGHTPSDIRYAPAASDGNVTTAGNLDFGVCHITDMPHSIVRTGAEVRRGSQDLVVVLLVGEGCCVVEQNGRTVPAFVDDVLVVFLDTPSRINLENTRKVDAARLPAAELPPSLRDESPFLISPRLMPTASIVAGHLRWQPRDLGELRSASDLVRSQMLALLSFAVQQLTQEPEPPRTLVEAVEALIEAEIANPALSAKLLCARLGVSRSKLFEALASRGTTLGILVRQRRLQGCLRDMRRDGPGTSIASIAGRWGYRNSATFSRAFRRHHGLAPSLWCGSSDISEPASGATQELNGGAIDDTSLKDGPMTNEADQMHPPMPSDSVAPNPAQLRAARAALGVTMIEAARHAGLSVSAVRRLEVQPFTGRPPIERSENLAGAYERLGIRFIEHGIVIPHRG